MIATVLFSVLLSATVGDVPHVIHDDCGPLRVGAEVAIPSGRLRVESLGRFGESVERKTRRAAERTPSHAGEECGTFFGTVPPRFKSTASLAELTANAEDVVTGSIVGARQGFHGGLPGTLLRIQATYLKGLAPAETYLFYPFARIPSNGTFVCAKRLGDFVPPQPGDRLLIFSTGKSIDWEGKRILQVDSERELVHEPRTGTLQVPAALLPHAGNDRQFDDVLQAVTRSLTGFGVRKNTTFPPLHRHTSRSRARG